MVFAQEWAWKVGVDPQFSPAHGCGRASTPLRQGYVGQVRIYGARLGQRARRNSTPAHFVSLAPCIFGHLRALASRSGEKCGLGD